jgi:hypothetical protein
MGFCSPSESIENIDPKGLYQIIKFFKSFHKEPLIPPEALFLQSFEIISRVVSEQ